MASTFNKLLRRIFHSSFFDKDWDDLIFERRNKQYGAYELRRVFAEYQARGLFFTIIFFCIFIFWVSYLHTESKPANFEFEEMIEYKGFDANLITVEPLKKEENKAELKEETVKEEPVQKELPPEPKEDVPEIKKETTTAVSDTSFKKEGKDGSKAEKADETGADSGITNNVYSEGPASPYGGLAEFMKWVQQHLVIPKEAIEQNVHGTIYVHFTIDEVGNITKVTLSKGLGYGCDEAVIDVVGKAPKWKPAFRDGKAAAQRFIIPVKI